MRMQLILGLREKVLGPLKSIQSGSQEAAQALKATRDQLRDLEKVQQDVGGLRTTRIQLRGQQRDLQELQGKLGSHNAALQDQRERHRQVTASLKTARESHSRLTQSLQNGAAATPEFTRQLELARISLLSSQGAYERSNASISKYRGQVKNTQTDIAQLTGKVAGGQERLRGYERRLQEAGIGTDRLGQKSRGFKAQMEAATAAVQKQKQSLVALKVQQERISALKAQHSKAMMHTGMVAGTGVAMVAAGRRGVDAGMAPVRSFSEHQDHMLGIARQIEGARDAGGSLTPVYYAIEEQVRGLSQRIPMATTAITDMVTAAARMEVPTDKLAEFTLMASEIATAFDAVPDQITESMGKVAKNFKIPLTDIRGLADSINYLDDNAISKGADIIDFLNRTSGVVSTVAMSAKDAAALGSTLLTLGERAETAGTAANAIVQKFAAASKGTKKFQSALKEINLSPDAVQQGMAKDATATLLEVVNSIRKLPDSQRIGVMVELVGMEHSDTLAKLVDKPEELQRQIGLANSEGAEGSMAREASARNATLSAQWQMSTNRAFNLSAALGSSLEPALLGLLNAVNPLLESFSQFVKENQSLVKWVLGSFVAFSALLVGLGALLIPLALIAGKAMLLRFAFGMLGIKLPGIIAAMRGLSTIFLRLGLAMLTTPVGWFIMGAAAIAAAAYAIYKNWEPIKQFFSGLWQSIGSAVSSAWQSITAILSNAWANVLATAGNIWQQLGGLVSAALLTIGAAIVNWSPAALFSQAFAGAMAYLGFELPARFTEFGANILQGLANGITSRLAVVRDAIGGAADSAVGWFKEKLGIHSPSRVFMAAGVNVGEGAALGIESTQGLLRKSALGLAAAASVALPAMAAMPTLSVGMAAAVQAEPVRIDNRQPLTATQAQRPAPIIQGDTITLQIHAAPGMDEQAIARLVSAELERRDRAKAARAQAAFYDWNS